MCPRFHIHAIEHRPAKIASQVFQRLLAPQVADRIATDIHWALVWLMPGASIVRSACIGFECMRQYIEARVGRCHWWQRHRIQWVDNSQGRTQVTMRDARLHLQ